MKMLQWFLCIFLVALVSCGYQFEGGGYINDDVTQIAVRVLENKSSESGAGIAFTNALIREIIQKTDTKVVDPSGATTFLEGTVQSITYATLSRTSTESVIDRRISAVVDLKLVNKDGDIIWSVKKFTSHEDYTVSEDKATDDSNKREAVNKIATRNAEKFITKMLINF